MLTFFAATLRSTSEDLFDRVTIKKMTKPEETTSAAIIREIKIVPDPATG